MPRKNMEKKYNEALKLASKFLSDSGYCTHYPGYLCDKGWPGACPACIKRYLLRKSKDANE